MKRMMVVIVTALLIILTTNCAQQPAPVTAPGASPTMRTQPSPASDGNTDWQTRWEKTLLAAKKEGELLVYMNIPAEGRVSMVDAFGKRFGIKMDTITGPTFELGTRLNSEYRAGVYQVDAFVGGASSITNVTKPAGYLSPLEPVLILPEVKDPKVWMGDQFPFFDKDRTVVSWLSIVSPGIVYNTDLVRPGEIGSYLDLLKPEWKDKVVISDPTTGGAGMFTITVLEAVWGVDRTRQYLTSMVKQQKIVIIRDQRLHLEWIVRGRYPVALGPNTPPLMPLLKAGVPLTSPPLKEGKGATPSNGNIALPTKPPHPNAATVFVNWLLTQQGQTIAARAFAASSARKDVAAEGVSEMFIAKPDEKIIFQSEELIDMQQKWLEEWKKIISE